MNYLSVKETAINFNISEHRVQQLCNTGQIQGAKMIRGAWRIPSNAIKPMDDRIISSPQNKEWISLNDFCKILSISIATGRNWIKLGKLTPQNTVKQTPFFTLDYVNSIKEELTKNKNTMLKSRRNKKYISGNNIYASYVSENSSALKTVQCILDYIAEKKIEINNLAITAIIAECAIQQMLCNTISFPENCLYQYLTGNLLFDGREFLIDDILEDNYLTLKFIEKYPDLFQVTYQFEENEDLLGLLYLSIKNLGDRKATGSYYTPTNIVKKLCSKLFEKTILSNKKILDPCCGTGNFLLQLPRDIPFENIYGNDIDSLSVKITRINLSVKYNIKDKKILYKHIISDNYLNHSFSEKFDYIIGNPPWGYEYSDEEKENLRNKYCCAAGSNIESYDIFIEQALSDLCTNGIISYILPEAFLNVKMHTPIRRILTEQCSFQYLHFLGNVFDKVQCPCIILQIILTRTPCSTIGLTVNNGKKEFTIHTKRIIDAECFSFSTTDEEYSILNKIETVQDKITLKGQAIFALGIVTGNNKKYIDTEKREDNEVILKGSDLYKYKFHPTSNYIVFQPELFQQVAPVEYYRAKEKLLYRFICNQLVFAYDSAQTLSLNSCNLLIPQVDGLNIKYIMAILNSTVAQFYFKKQFNSVKVLRSYIEQIPIPKIKKEQQEALMPLIEELIAANDPQKIQTLYKSLDIEIAQLYKLNCKEYNIIQESINGENLFLFK